ncbi:Prophage CP4-57 regulatory protein (AlpA) [compost metagenome]
MRVMTAKGGQTTPGSLVTRNVDEQTARATVLLQEALSLLASKEAFGSAHVSRPPDRLLRLPEVQRLTGLGRSAIYQQMKEGFFPRSVKIGPRAATWSEAAVQAWIHQRLA